MNREHAGRKADKKRVLVISHGHPQFSKGGGEVAAYNLFLGLRNHPDVEACWFLGANPKSPTGNISMLREDEYIWGQTVQNAFLMKAAVPDSTIINFSAFLRKMAPTVIHFHHYMHVGIEAFVMARKSCPSARIVLTLHEMLGICLSDGQMVKRNDMALCYKESPQGCNECFPQYSSEDFWLRKRWFLKHFEVVDHFVSPSDFLRKRYEEWGIPSIKLSTIENGLPKLDCLHLKPTKQSKYNKIGYFGQINPYKGVDLLLKALALLPVEIRGKLSIEIHGANLASQQSEFRELINKLIEPLVEANVVRMMGTYGREELCSRMANVDWIIVPSIWWENSPVVIQEAFAMGKPVICSNIGGMAEKVAHGVNGLHFSARSLTALSDMLTSIANGEVPYERLSAGVKYQANLEAAVLGHIDVYGRSDPGLLS